MKIQLKLSPSVLLFGLILNALIASLGFAQATTSDPSLKLHLNFDGGFPADKVLDVSGNENHGWQQNSTNRLTATNGIFSSQAAQFTYVGFMTNDPPHLYQVSQYIALTNLVGFAYLTNGTISVWAKFDTNYDTVMYLLDCGYNTLYSGNPSACSNSWTLGRLGRPYLSFVTYPSSGGARTIVSWPDDTVRSGGSSPDLSTKRFHLYTVTFDCANNQAIAYYDGTPYQTNTVGVPWLRIYGCSSIRWLCAGAMAHVGTPFWGDDKYPNSGFFVGKMDDLRIYNRTLSPKEVEALYNGAGTPAEPLQLRASNSGLQSVQVSWVGLSNVYYQVQARSNLVVGAWNNLGASNVCLGGTNSISDSTAGREHQFYRVRPLP